MIGRNFKIALLLGFLTLAFDQPVAAQDWPGWRGPNRDGVVTGFAARKNWPDKLKLLWKANVGTGHASPVVSGKQIFIHTRQQEREVVSNLDLDTGKLLWQESYPVSYTMNPAAVSHGKGPKSTPVVHSGRLYTLGISGIISCFDAKTGKLQWRKDYSSRYKYTSPLYGTAMSPMVEGNLLIAHIGGHGAGALTAFDAATGEERWSWKEDGPGYASPIAVVFDGVGQVVTQTQQNIVGLEAATGKLLWSIPYTTPYTQNIVTPLIYNHTLIYSGLDKGTTAVKVIRRGTAWATERVWHNSEVSMYMSSPVLIGDFVYGLSHKRKGQYFCMDARTGKTVWTSEGRDGDNAAIVVAGGALLLLNDSAELIVARGSDKAFEPLKKYEVADSPTWAHPVVVGNRVLIKDAESLALWSLD
ncbi:MAG: PQQ-like beta-propeller repeat protein [Blastocatellia bacterium]|nr:PQQ-like beta-propeller repeat protein [Blastocatellia bacterium]